MIRLRWYGTPLLGVVLAACIGPLVEDPSFDLWCDETLCTWEVDQGRIEKVPTWHRSDFGVELAGSSTQISQFRAFEDVSCVRFEVLSDVEARTDTRLQLDFNDDGSIDKEWPLPAERWTKSTFTLRAPLRYRGVRFILRKHSEGHAALAQMLAVEALQDECAAKPLVLEPQGDGAACDRDDQCAEGLCAAGSCNTCAEDGACALGHACGEAQHCESGACRFGVCSECESDTDCNDDEACDRAGYTESESFASCQPTAQLEDRELGQPCARDGQCKDGFACTATSPNLEPRCGMACAGTDDDACRDDAVCVALQASGDDRVSDQANVCLEANDCEHLPGLEALACVLQVGTRDTKPGP